MIPYLNKEHQDLPDYYTIKVFYLSGGREEFELASHRLDAESKILEIRTKDDLCMWVLLENVNRVEFDKNFSKIISIKETLNNETSTVSQ